MRTAGFEVEVTALGAVPIEVEGFPRKAGPRSAGVLVAAPVFVHADRLTGAAVKVEVIVAYFERC